MAKYKEKKNDIEEKIFKKMGLIGCLMNIMSSKKKSKIIFVLNIYALMAVMGGLYYFLFVSPLKHTTDNTSIAIIATVILIILLVMFFITSILTYNSAITADKYDE